MARPVVIRPATLSDAAELSTLMDQLGYPATPAEMAERLEAIIAAANYQTIVVEDEGHIIGMVGDCVVGPIYEKAGSGGHVMALVVAPDARHRGIGAALMAAGEYWLQTQGVQSIYLVSSATRTEAHGFYERLGYQHAAGEFLFVKDRIDARTMNE
jgi:GNAT superfamily N-acetyltransferase